MENILINIDSAFRNKKLYPNPGHFIHTLDEQVKNVLYIRISSVELPTTYYTFQSILNNISFTIIINNNNNLYFVIKIKEGNYTSDLFIAYVQSQFDVINKANASQLKITWDTITYKTTLSNNLPFTVLFDSDNNHISLGNRMGFTGSNTSYLYNNQKSYFDQTTLLNVYAWVGETFLNITKDNYLFIKINDYGIINNNNNIGRSILAKIPLYDKDIVFDNGANLLSKIYKFRSPVNISKLDIELLNPFGNVIEMGLVDFSLTVELGQIYNENDYINLSKNKYNIV